MRAAKAPASSDDASPELTESAEGTSACDTAERNSASERELASRANSRNVKVRRVADGASSTTRRRCSRSAASTRPAPSASAARRSRARCHDTSDTPHARATSAANGSILLPRSDRVPALTTSTGKPARRSLNTTAENALRHTFPVHTVKIRKTAPSPGTARKPNPRIVEPMATDSTGGTMPDQNTATPWGTREAILVIASLTAALLLAVTMQNFAATRTVEDLLLAVFLPTIVTWAGLALPVFWVALGDHWMGNLHLRPAPVDLAYALLFGIGLRLVAQVIETLAYGSPRLLLPSVTLFDGHLPQLYWFTAIVADIFVSPVLEELAFRGVIQRGIGHKTPWIGCVASALLFSLFHVVSATGQSAAGLTTTLVTTLLVGAVCGALTLVTGRLTAAIGIHVVYNASAVGIALTLAYM